MSEVQEKNEPNSLLDEYHSSIQSVKVDKNSDTWKAETREDETLIDHDSIPSFQNIGSMEYQTLVHESNIDEQAQLKNEELCTDETQAVSDDRITLSNKINDNEDEHKDDESNASLIEHVDQTYDAEMKNDDKKVILPDQKDYHGNDGFQFLLEEDDKMLDYDEPSQLDRVNALTTFLEPQLVWSKIFFSFYFKLLSYHTYLYSGQIS